MNSYQSLIHWKRHNWISSGTYWLDYYRPKLQGEQFSEFLLKFNTLGRDKLNFIRETLNRLWITKWIQWIPTCLGCTGKDTNYGIHKNKEKGKVNQLDVGNKKKKTNTTVVVTIQGQLSTAKKKKTKQNYTKQTNKRKKKKKKNRWPHLEQVKIVKFTAHQDK